MPKHPKTEQNRPELPWNELPVPLPDEFPFACSDTYIQTDQPITMLHRHDVPEIGYCHRGSGIWIIGGKILPFSQGDIIVITEEEPHLAQSAQGTTSEWTWIYSDPVRLFGPAGPAFPVPDLSRLAGFSFVNIVPQGVCPQARMLAESIIAECRRPGANHRQAISGMLYALMSLLARFGVDRIAGNESGAATGVRADMGRMARAVEYICNKYHSPVSVDELARLCNLSVTHFRRIFTRAMGKSPLEYIAAIRLSMAELDLRSSNRSISQISLRAGFPTLSAFNRLFKLKNKCTPREWRRKN